MAAHAPTTSGSATTTATEGPSGFSPASVTFASATTGWVLGTVPAGSNARLVILHTTDAGTTWSRSPAPDVTFDYGWRGLALIRFADPTDGWITTPLTQTPGRHPTSTLWSTHDAGKSWHQVAVPSGGNITALEASDRVFQLAELANDGNDGNDGTAVALYTSPATSDAWTRASTSLAIGAGPIPYAELTLQGEEGWAMEIDRTVGPGARLDSGSWESWTPPCTDANGWAYLAASSATSLVALCEEGLWGPPAPGTTTGPWLFSSADGGDRFAVLGAVPTTPAARGAYSLATPPGEPQVIVVGGSGLVATFDGGHTWKVVDPASPGQVRFIGFTTATQGVAIVTGGTSASTLVMTSDGGAAWHRVQV